MQVAVRCPSGGMYTHSRDLFKVSGKPLELQATAASTDNKVGCSRRGNTPLDGNNAWRLGDPLPSSRVGEGTQTVRKGVTTGRGSLIFSRSPGKPVRVQRKGHAEMRAWRANLGKSGELIPILCAGICATSQQSLYAVTDIKMFRR